MNLMCGIFGPILGDLMRVVRIFNFALFGGCILNNKLNNIEKHKREWIECCQSTVSASQSLSIIGLRMKKIPRTVLL